MAEPSKIVIDPKSVKAIVAFSRKWASTVRRVVDDFSETGGNVVKKK